MAVSVASNAPVSIPLMSPDEEDRIILERIQVDDRPLRRLIKKFHTYSTALHPSSALFPTQDALTAQDARDAFLTELAAFELLLKKNRMVCEGEARQVEEYQRERQRLDAEQETLIAQIEELKEALEQAQMLRRRKIEYDLVAEKVNTLPSRAELEADIAALENDMAAIHAEHDAQQRIITGQKGALDSIIADLTNLRSFGKEPEPTPSRSAPQSPLVTPLPDTDAPSPLTSIGSDSEDEREEGEEKETKGSAPTSKADALSEGAIEEDDIEMGEVDERPNSKDKPLSRKKAREEMEEGEATDASSELSDPPDD